MIIRKIKNYQSVKNCLQTYYYIWCNNRVNEFGNLLHNKSNLEEEGIQDAVPYKDKLDRLYEYLDISQKSSIERITFSALFFLYWQSVSWFKHQKINAMEWYLPRKETIVWYVSRLLLIDPNLINKDEKF
jgi:hypothetical protein